MSVSAVSGSSGGGATSDAGSIQSLLQQAKSVQQQLAAAEKDTTMDAKTKAALVTQLSAQLAMIQAEITQKQQQAAQAAARAAQSQSSPAAASQSTQATAGNGSDQSDSVKSTDGTGTHVNTYA